MLMRKPSHLVSCFGGSARRWIKTLRIGGQTMIGS